MLHCPKGLLLGREVPTHIRHFTFPSLSDVGLLTILISPRHGSYNPPRLGPNAGTLSVEVQL
ncbi:hypothetical protein GBA52_010301 [Prunus armeniaca]|nr:hypothetical protein GBA52_010301 [Prunus armeniaca]